MPGSLARFDSTTPIRPAYSDRVSEQTESVTGPENAGPKTESHDPAVPEAYAAFMRTGWGERELDLPAHPVAEYAEARRARLAEAFPGERLVLPAGTY